MFLTIFFQVFQTNAGLQELESQLDSGTKIFLKSYVTNNLEHITFLNNIIKIIENSSTIKNQTAFLYFKGLVESYGNNNNNNNNNNNKISRTNINNNNGNIINNTISNGTNNIVFDNNGGGNNGTVKIAIMGDQNGSNSATIESFKLVKSEGAELIIHNGDFLNNGDSWDKMVTNILGPNFPIIATMGNHDVDWKEKNSWSKFQKILIRRMNNSSLNCSGELGKKSVCTFKGIKIITVSPNINSGDHAGFIKSNLENDKFIWKICQWHKNMRKMQLGPKNENIGRGVYEESRKAGCITTNGHDHSYGRTYLLDNMETQHVINNSKNGPYLIKPGQTIHLLVGSSGMGLYEGDDDIINLPHWAVKYVKTDNDAISGKGVLFCTFKGRKADCYFKSVSGQIKDRFSLISGN